MMKLGHWPTGVVMLGQRAVSRWENEPAISRDTLNLMNLILHKTVSTSRKD